MRSLEASEAEILADLRANMKVLPRPEFTAAPPVLTAEEIAESVRLAQRVKPPFEAIRINRESGAMIGIVINKAKSPSHGAPFGKLRTNSSTSRARESHGSSRRRTAASRGSPSGSDDGEPPRPATARPLLDHETRQRLKQLVSEEKRRRIERAQRSRETCSRDGCENQLVGRSDTRYCSHACKQAAYRERTIA
jgi:hypothetical protein